MKTLSIKQLYPLALAEGEGVGTAYEYYVKRLVLRRWLRALPSPRRMLIAGLPQKYGASLDFLLIAQELGTAVTIIDERESALEKAEHALTTAQQKGYLQQVSPIYHLVEKLADLPSDLALFDLCLCSEVLQRLLETEAQRYLVSVNKVAGAFALFVPNGDNEAHINISGLKGLTLAQLDRLAPGAKAGYIDMPPFPPGITRTAAQREQATHGALEAFAMWGLGFYAYLERWFPDRVRRHQAHIIFALS